MAVNLRAGLGQRALGASENVPEEAVPEPNPTELGPGTHHVKKDTWVPTALGSSPDTACLDRADQRLLALESALESGR